VRFDLHNSALVHVRRVSAYAPILRPVGAKSRVQIVKPIIVVLERCTGSELRKQSPNAFFCRDETGSLREDAPRLSFSSLLFFPSFPPIPFPFVCFFPLCSQCPLCLPLFLTPAAEIPAVVGD
jgi:hypothetical protein